MGRKVRGMQKRFCFMFFALVAVCCINFGAERVYASGSSVQALTAIRPQMQAYEIFERFSDAVFTIYVSYDGTNFRGSASGFIVDPSGLAVTAQHCLGAPFMRARMQNGSFYDIIGVHNYDVVNDLALIQIDGSGFPYVLLGDSDTVRPGQDITVIGTSRGTFHNRIVPGMVTGFGDFDAFPHNVVDAIMTEASIYGGNSGGPVFDRYGFVIGVIVGRLYEAQDIGGSFIWLPTSMNYVTPINRLSHDTLPPDNLISLAGFHFGFGDAVPYEYLVGYWIWAGGHYVFNADGTGSRDWFGFEGGFEWSIEEGNILVIVQNNEEERWMVRVDDADSLIIGGSFFFRTDGMPEQMELQIIMDVVGTWQWSGGIYIFNADGTGWRDWYLAPGYFYWSASDDHISTMCAFGIVDRWRLNIYDSNNISIGGAHMVRRGNQTHAHLNPSAVIIGVWMIGSDEIVGFSDDGTGFVMTFLVDGTFDHEEFVWRIDGSYLAIDFADETFVFGIVVISENSLRLTDEYGSFMMLRSA